MSLIKLIFDSETRTTYDVGTVDVDKANVINGLTKEELEGIVTPLKGNVSLTGSNTDNLSISSKHHINLEAGLKGVTSTKSGDIQFKPGDDIAFYAHHREAEKTDEISFKIALSVSGGTKDVDYPVKLQIQAANLTLSTKGKDLTKTFHKDASGNVVHTGSASEDEIFDLNINTGKDSGNKKGYLKVRARAIDLRCEEHGGIAIQPKGFDNGDENGVRHMNKIKFEHGGGDGLEFGTFNTVYTSLFTEEYRFNRDGKIYPTTRATTESTKYDGVDPTTKFKYIKQDDDSYDIKQVGAPEVTWGDLIDAVSYVKSNKDAIDITLGSAPAGGEGSGTGTGSGLTAVQSSDLSWVHDNKTALESAISSGKLTELQAADIVSLISSTSTIADWSGVKNAADYSSHLYVKADNGHTFVDATANDVPAVKFTQDEIDSATENDAAYQKTTDDIKTEAVLHNANIKSAAKIGLKSPIVEIEGVLSNASETNSTIQENVVYTSKGNKKGSVKLSCFIENKNASEFTYAGETIAAGTTKEINVDLADVIVLTNWMKENNLGPWAQATPEEGLV